MDKKREEIEEKYKWDLTKIYKSEKDFLNDLKDILKEIETLPKYKETMTKSGKNLYDAMDAIFSVSSRIDKIYTYSHLKKDEDVSLSSSIEREDKAKTAYLKFNQAISYFDPILLKLDYSKIEEMYKEYPKLKEYEIYLKNMFRFQDYKLSEVEEKLIADLSNTYSETRSIFSSLTNSDMDFGTILDENNNEVVLTNTNYLSYIKSNDRRVRRDAFLKLHGTYERFKTTLAKLLESRVKKAATFDKIRGYKSSLDAAMYKDELDTKVYNALIESVSNGLDPLFKYFKLKKEVLDIDELHIYDTYADMIPSYDKKYSFEDAKKLIKETLSIFGEDYLKNIDKAFDEHWIDVMPNKGKRGGAYSGGCYDTNPYILTNFQERFDDVSTLIHELGHSMHSYYSRNNNTYQNADYSIVVAEVASTVNELLLAKHVLSTSNDDDEKLYILDRLMNLFKSTIYRQTMYEEFEKFLYETVEKEESLTSDVLAKKFYELNEKYYGKDVVLDPVIQYEWARMPHLYYGFYMYKYATGLSAACQIVNQILEGKENAVENYLEFLKTGCTLPPNEELKINGVDLTKKTVCDNAIKMFSDVVDEAEKIYKKKMLKSGELDGQKRLLWSSRGI